MRKTKYEMSPANLQRLRRWLSWILGALILATGVALMVNCLAIDQSGQAPFTRESIGMGLRRVAPLMVACAIGLLAEALCALIVSFKGENGTADERSRVKAVRFPSVQLKKQIRHLNMDAIPPEFRQKMNHERAWRRRLSVGTAVLSAGLALLAVIWCMDVSRFSVDYLNRDVITATMVISGCAVLELAVWFTAKLLRDASILRELTLIQTVKALPDQSLLMAEGHEKQAFFDRSYRVWILRGGIAVAAILLIALGVCNGGMADVLGKAIRICTECIGLG